MAGAVCQRSHVGVGADLHVVGEHAVGAQDFVGCGGSAEDHHAAVSSGAAAGQGQHSAALQNGGGCLLADGHAENVSDGHVVDDQAVVFHGADVLVESLAH